jgi:hypothetical protein
MTHTLFLTTLGGAGKVEAKIAGVKFVKTLLQIRDEADGTNEAPEVTEFVDGCHLTLGFIWVMCKGMTKGVTFLDPPKSKTVDKKGSSLIDQLKEKGSSTKKKRSKRKKTRSSKKPKSTIGGSTMSKKMSPSPSSLDSLRHHPPQEPVHPRNQEPMR